MSGKINKSRSTGNFTIIPNAALENDELSLKAKGLLCYLLRFPPDWTLYKSTLHASLKEGRESVANAFKELEDAGYIKRIHVRGEGGAFTGYDYEIFDSPVNQLTGNPSTGDQLTGLPGSRKSDDNNTYNSSNTIPSPSPKVEEEGASSIPTEKNGGNTPPGSAPPPRRGKSSGTNGKAGKPLYRSRERPTDSKTGEPAQNASKSIYPEFIELYHDWFKNRNDGVPPKIDGAGGKAAKSMIVYLRQIVATKERENGRPTSGEDFDKQVLASWQYILVNWERVEPFYRDRTRLIDINSNLQNIINQLKNGHSKQRSGPITGSDMQRNFNNLAEKAAAYERAKGRG